MHMNPNCQNIQNERSYWQKMLNWTRVRYWLSLHRFEKYLEKVYDDFQPMKYDLHSSNCDEQLFQPRYPKKNSLGCQN